MSLLSKLITLGIILSSISPQLKSLRFKKEISKDSEGPLEEPSERALLKEYEVCQSHNNALGQQSWVSISILITVNILVLAQVASEVILKTIPTLGFADLILVILLGLPMIFILAVFWRWQKRIQLLAWLNNHRMQEIEQELGFEIWKNWRARGLDLYYGKNNDEQKKKKWDKLNPKLKEMIQQLSEYYPQEDKEAKENENFETMYRLPTTEGCFLKGQFKFKCVFPTLMVVWAILIFYVIGMIICRFIN